MSKCDKDYVESFFRNMRFLMSDMSEKVTMMSRALPDRITREELRIALEQITKGMTAKQTPLVRTTNYKCFFCGAKQAKKEKDREECRTPPPADKVIQRDKGVFKGRAVLQSSITAQASNEPTEQPEYEPSYLPKL